MVKVTNEVLEKLERLSYVKINPEKIPSMLKNMQEILEYMQMLEKVDTDGVDEMYTPIETECSLKDRPAEKKDYKAIVDNFPDKSGNSLKVPGINK